MIDKEIRRAIESEAKGAEEAAVYNLNKIQKLERRATDQELTASVLKDAFKILSHLLEEEEIRGDILQNALADACRNHALLVRLVERVGHNLAVISGEGWDNTDYTVAEQRRLDAEAHEAEGPPPDAGMLENVQ